MSFILTFWALLALGYTATVLWELRRTEAPRDGASPPILLLRPVDAPTAQELSNLAAPIAYAGTLVQVVISPYRPRLPDQVRWLYSDPTARNRKVGHLLHGLETLDVAGRVVVAVDADVRVTPALLRALAEAVTSGADLAAAPPVIAEGSGWGSRLFSALLAHTHLSFRAQAATPARAPAICGKAVALGPRAQTTLGELSSVVGEDLELAARLTAAGGTVRAVTEPAQIHDGARTAGRALERGIRWLQVARAHRPVLFFFVPVFVAPTWLLAAAALGTGAPILSLVVLALVIARTLLSWRLGALLRSAASPGEWLLGEALLLAAFAGAVASPRRIAWRDRVLTLGRGGAIEAVHSAWALRDAEGAGR